MQNFWTMLEHEWELTVQASLLLQYTLAVSVSSKVSGASKEIFIILIDPGF